MDTKQIQIPQRLSILLPWMLIQKTLFRQEGKINHILISRSFVSVVSTVFLISVSLLPYLDIFIGFFTDLNQIPSGRFANFSTAIWTYSMCVSPPLILLASKFKPYWFSYIIPIYVYTTMFCGFLFLDININIKSDWIFRLITFTLSLTVLFTVKFVLKIYKTVRFKEEVMNEYLNLRKNG